VDACVATAGRRGPGPKPPPTPERWPFRWSDPCASASPPGTATPSPSAQGRDQPGPGGHRPDAAGQGWRRADPRRGRSPRRGAGDPRRTPRRHADARPYPVAGRPADNLRAEGRWLATGSWTRPSPASRREAGRHAAAAGRGDGLAGWTWRPGAGRRRTRGRPARTWPAHHAVARSARRWRRLGVQRPGYPGRRGRQDRSAICALLAQTESRRGVSSRGSKGAAARRPWPTSAIPPGARSPCRPLIRAPHLAATRRVRPAFQQHERGLGGWQLEAAGAGRSLPTGPRRPCTPWRRSIEDLESLRPAWPPTWPPPGSEPTSASQRP
jgi:hypothetical protein